MIPRVQTCTCTCTCTTVGTIYVNKENIFLMDDNIDNKEENSLRTMYDHDRK